MPIHNVLQALECYDVCHPKWWTVANSQGAGCQARIDLYTNTMLPLQGILVYNTGLETCNRTYVKLMSDKQCSFVLAYENDFLKIAFPVCKS